VEGVQVESIDSLRRSNGDMVATVTWHVSGSVNHYGHTHSRRNAYTAGLRMKDIDGTWKISAIEVHGEERVY
jgi:ketosteroid isomerase-like protein